MTFFATNKLNVLCSEAHVYHMYVLGGFTWLPFLFLIILIRVRNAVTSNNTAQLTMAFAAALPVWSWCRCCRGLIAYLGKDSRAFTVGNLPSSGFPPLFCVLCSLLFLAQGLSAWLSVRVGTFSSSKEYSGSNSIKGLWAALSDSGKEILY